MTKNKVSIQIYSEQDIVLIRQLGRELAQEIGFNQADQARIVIGISELARNLFLYAKKGEIQIDRKVHGTKTGILIKSIDCGPGIESISRAMMDGFSTSGGLGLGLSGINRLMDEFSINSELGSGTEIVVIKWCTKKSTIV